MARIEGTRAFSFTEPSLNLNGKCVMVTGGTGSFGKAFVRHVLRLFDIGRIIIYSRDELKQFDFHYELQREFSEEKLRCVRFCIGDVRNADRLKQVMEGVDYVVHAAAIKQIPAAEYNPMECVLTNVIGAQNVIESALYCNVRKVIALSTDKAACPTNLYGATKLTSDKLFIAANNISDLKQTAFSVVRYGNVLGSRGSVIPLFSRMLSEGATELPVTHPEMTRFWITLEQAVNFVLSNLELMRGGEIFVPKLEKTSIVQLVRILARREDFPLKITAIRPGEKIHEEMITVHDAIQTLELSDRHVVLPILPPYKRLAESLDMREYYSSLGGQPVDHTWSSSSLTAPEMDGAHLMALIERDQVTGLNAVAAWGVKTL